MIPRTLASHLKKLETQYPAIAILGPRQSGKTTLAKKLFPNKAYANLEAFDMQEYAREDPRGFVAQFRETGVILDEIQKVPHLLSELQVHIDEHNINGHFIITGSQNILLNQHIGQTLAGRIALTTLLPFSFEELRAKDALPQTAHQAIFNGFYPRVYDSQLDPSFFANNYIRTYVERDVRDIKHITSLSDFQKFLRLCAGRIGQLLNLTQLSNDSGLSLATVKAWLSILEATYVIFLLRPYHNNFKKRLVKMPKLYFYDTGLACRLLGLRSGKEVYMHYLRGGLFESMIIANIIKNRYHALQSPNIYFWRDKHGNEIDCLLEEGMTLQAIEIKSTETLSSTLFEGLKKWTTIAQDHPHKNTLVYAGDTHQKRREAEVCAWSTV